MFKKKRKVTQRELQSLESGLKINNTIQVMYPQSRSIFNVVFLLTISFLGLFGTTISFITLFSIPVDMVSILIYGTIFFGLFSVVSILSDKYMFVLIPILLFYIYLISDYIQELSLGFKIVANSVAYAVHSIGVWTKYYDVPSDIVTSEYSTMFLLFCMFLIACMICISTIKLQSCIVGFAITFPFIECGLYFGLVPDYVSFFMVVCYWIALLSIALSGYKKNVPNKTSGFVRVGNSFYAKSNNNFHIAEKVGVYSIVICILCALISGTFVTVSNYERSAKVDDIRSAIKESVEDFSLENAPYIMSRLGSLLSSSNNGTFNGTLGQKDTVEYDDVEKLSITTDILPVSDIYLKGYVGSDYTGQSWDMLDSKTYKVALFDTFKESTLYPQDLLYSLIDVPDSTFNTYNMTIQPVKKNLRTTFIPYFSKIQNNYSYVNDTLIQSQERESYSFKVIDVPYSSLYNNTALTPISSYTIPTNDIAFNYEEYLQFVKENYLQFEDNQSMESVKDIFSSYIGKLGLDFDTFKEEGSIHDKLEYIKQFLCYNYDYTLSPGKTPVGEDYIEYFLTQMDKGFCSHFASTGTILCRMLDIPSRYVEGYYVSVDRFNINSEGTYTASVEDNMAHAWTEIYVDGLGWINYDFTPGFNDNPTKADLLNAPESPDDAQQEVQDTTQPIQTEVSEVPDDGQVTTDAGSNQDGMSEVTTTSSNNDSKPQTHVDSRALKVLKNVLLLTFIVALVVVTIVFRRRYIVKGRTQRISSEDSRLSILSAYEYIVLLLNFIGITREGSVQHLDFANDAAKEVSYVKEFPKVMEIVLKVDLSGEDATECEKTFVTKFTEELPNTIYERQSRLGKFIMKYVMCLI